MKYIKSFEQYKEMVNESVQPPSDDEFEIANDFVKKEYDKSDGPMLGSIGVDKKTGKINIEVNFKRAKPSVQLTLNIDGTIDVKRMSLYNYDNAVRVLAGDEVWKSDAVQGDAMRKAWKKGLTPQEYVDTLK